jgi:hypothetical protein
VGATDNIDAEVGEARLQVDAMDALVRATVTEAEPLLSEWATIVRSIRAASRQAHRTAARPPAPMSTGTTTVTPSAGEPGAPQADEQAA